MRLGRLSSNCRTAATRPDLVHPDLDEPDLDYYGSMAAVSGRFVGRQSQLALLTNHPA